MDDGDDYDDGPDWDGSSDANGSDSGGGDGGPDGYESSASGSTETDDFTDSGLDTGNDGIAIEDEDSMLEGGYGSDSDTYDPEMFEGRPGYDSDTYDLEMFEEPGGEGYDPEMFEEEPREEYYGDPSLSDSWDDIDFTQTMNTPYEQSVLREMSERGEIEVQESVKDVKEPEFGPSHLPTERTGAFEEERGNSGFVSPFTGGTRRDGEVREGFG